MKLVLRIKDSDFSEFAGFNHTDSAYAKHNEELNRYIELYKENDDIKYFQIEFSRSAPIHILAYICHKVQEKYFIKTDFSENVQDYKYWLCFYKESKNTEE